jgi:hypothetical protein
MTAVGQVVGISGGSASSARRSRCERTIAALAECGGCRRCMPSLGMAWHGMGGHGGSRAISGSAISKNLRSARWTGGACSSAHPYARARHGTRSDASCERIASPLSGAAGSVGPPPEDHRDGWAARRADPATTGDAGCLVPAVASRGRRSGMTGRNFFCAVHDPATWDVGRGAWGRVTRRSCNTPASSDLHGGSETGSTRLVRSSERPARLTPEQRSGVMEQSGPSVKLAAAWRLCKVWDEACLRA